jgi:hypothetical protein
MSRTLTNFRNCAIALVCLLSWVSFAPIATAQNNNDFGNAIGNILLNAIENARIQSIQKSWAQLDPAIAECLVSKYQMYPDQLAQSGISAKDSRLKQYIADCQQLTTPPPVEYSGYVQGPAGKYTRTSPALAQIASRFFVLVQSAEIRSADWDALLNGVKQKADRGCSGQNSVPVFELHDGKDMVSQALRLQDPWVFAEVECSAEMVAIEDQAGAMAVEDLAAGVAGAQYFGVHSVSINADYDSSFEATLRTLERLSGRIEQSDKKKGVIVTAGSHQRSPLYTERYFIVLDPETDAKTRVTFELISAASYKNQPDELALVAEDRESVDRRANQFVQALLDAVQHRSPARAKPFSSSAIR